MAILTTREATLKEGYLFKQSRTVWKLWKARFFILKTTGLFYYKKKSYCTGLALGVISLKDISMQVDEVGDRRRKFCLKINADGKNFSLCCFSEDERNSWMTAILTAVTSYVINHYEGAKTDEISYMTRGKSLSRSKSFDAITGAKLNPPKASTLSTSATDLDRIVLRDAKSTPLPKRKQKAFSHWDFKWRNSYISFDVIWSAREHSFFFVFRRDCISELNYQLKYRSYFVHTFWMIFLIHKERNIDVFKCTDRNHKFSVGSCSICVGLENIVPTFRL